MATPVIKNPPNPSKSSIMQRKVLGIPLPIAVGVLALAGFLVYRHFKTGSSSTTSGTSSSSAPDPNAIDPNTGLTYGAEEQAGLGSIAAGPSTNGTGTGGVGGEGLSVGDLEGLLTALQGFGGTTNYYYGGGGSGVNQTPTNPTGAGNGTSTGNNIGTGSGTDTGAGGQSGSTGASSNSAGNNFGGNEVGAQTEQSGSAAAFNTAFGVGQQQEQASPQQAVQTGVNDVGSFLASPTPVPQAKQATASSPGKVVVGYAPGKGSSVIKT
jgi:hypothetical protein